MISASADFIAQESNPDTAQPVFLFTFFPHYFATGVATGSGTFVNTTYVDPGRVQVDDGAGAASWTSPTLQALVGELPTSFTPSWQLDYPGFDVAVEYRTATTEVGLAGAAWATLSDGTPVSVYRYYQWRITWSAIRSWAYDTEEEAEASDSSAWALDAADPEDSYESFAVDTAFAGIEAYIEQVRFTGVFEIDQDDIKDPGECVDEISGDLGDLIAGDHTLTLVNRDNRYSPRHANFIFAQEENWKKKWVLIEMAYRLPSGVLTERLPLYPGIIEEWGPAVHLVDEDGKLQEHTITVYTRDIMANLMDLKIGTPDDDGKPTPLVFGEILRQADQLADETLGDPDAATDFEDGDTSGLTGVDSGSGGVVAVESTDPFTGAYYLHTEIAAANAYAKGRMDLAAAGSEVLFTTQMRFVTIPESPADKNMHFMGLYNAGGTEILQLYVGSDARVYAYAGGEYKETDWYVDRDLGVVVTVSIGVSAAAAGVIKIWVNGNEVLTWDEDWSALSIKGGFIGPHNAGTAEGWEIDSADWKIFPNWWPQLFRVPGGPYESIGTIYVDGATKVGTEPLYTDLNRRGLRYGPAGVASRFVGGSTKSAGVEKYPEYGAIAFTDYANKVSGTVMAYLRANDQAHWADIVRGLLEVHGKEDLLDETAAAAAKAATPDDTVGAYFENTTIGDAIRALAATCLFYCYRSQNRIVLEAYTATPPASSSLEGNEMNLIGVTPVDGMKDIKNKVFVKWGLYERNNRLSCIVKDDLSISYLGTYDTEIDLAWGSTVGSDNGQMAKQKAAWLLARLSGGRLLLEEVVSHLGLARIEVGDSVSINIADLGASEIYRVIRKGISMASPKGVKLQLVQYLGEAA